MKLQFSLCLLTSLGAVCASTAPVAECTAQAWVRAPDLTPNAMVHGDARVKISAECPAVETVSLGLRLKERTFVKALRSPEDRKRIFSVSPAININPQEASPWAFPMSKFANRSDELAFYEMVANKDLWMVQEEERLVFETTQAIPLVEGTSQDHDVIQDFSVLVPSTNFPPALDYLNSGFAMAIGGNGDIEIVDVEAMYEYFVRIPFANGTTADISAGFTGFQPLYDPTASPPNPSSDIIQLEPRRFGQSDGGSPRANYTAHIRTISGLVFAEGAEDQIVNVVITRTGPARTFTAPLTARVCVEPTFSPKWAVEYDMAFKLPRHRPAYIVRSTLEDVEEAKRNSWNPSCLGRRDGGVSITMPNSTSDEIESHEIVTTTSESITIPIQIDRRQITDFETYYQNLTNLLQITLETPRSDGNVDPDDPSAKPPTSWEPAFENDEEEWVPWERKKQILPNFASAYTGSLPATVRPVREDKGPWRCLDAGLSDQVILTDERGCEGSSLVHYLDKGARGPVFVDGHAVRTPPILEPVVSTPPQGGELIFRYYMRPSMNRPLIYVGETWARKLAPGREIDGEFRLA